MEYLTFISSRVTRSLLACLWSLAWIMYVTLEVIFLDQCEIPQSVLFQTNLLIATYKFQAISHTSPNDMTQKTSSKHTQKTKKCGKKETCQDCYVTLDTFVVRFYFINDKF